MATTRSRRQLSIRRPKRTTNPRRVYTAAMSSVGLAAAMAGLVVGRNRNRRSRRRSSSGLVERARHSIKERAHDVSVRQRYARGRARGTLHRVLPHQHSIPPDGQLEDRIKSMMFRDPLVPKRDISIVADRGIITLGGHVRTARMAEEIERRTRAIPDVTGVRNLLVVGNNGGEPGAMG